MKRFLLIVLAFIIAILPINVEAADLPDFGDVDEDNLVFKGTQYDNSYDIQVYMWYVVDANDTFAERYVHFLTNNYPFKYLGNYVKNAKRGDNETETWFFYYTGSKQVQTFTPRVDNNTRPYSCHVTLKRYRNYRRGHTEFTIRVAHGLDYPRNSQKPSPSEINDKDKKPNCPSCGGSGICKECGGSGRVNKWGGDGVYNVTCTACAGMGKCRYCYGTGKVDR